MKTSIAWRRSRAALWALIVLACLQIASQFSSIYQILSWLRAIITVKYPVSEIPFSYAGLIAATACVLIPAILLLVLSIWQLNKKTAVSVGGTFAYLTVYLLCVLAIPMIHHLPPFYLYESLGIYSREMWGFMQQMDPTAGTNTPDLQVFYMLPLLFAGLCVPALVGFFLSRAHWSGKLCLILCILGLLVTSRWFSVSFYADYAASSGILYLLLKQDFLRADFWFILLHSATILVYLLSLKRCAVQPEAEPADAPVPA